MQPFWSDPNVGPGPRTGTPVREVGPADWGLTGVRTGGNLSDEASLPLNISVGCGEPRVQVIGEAKLVLPAHRVA